jgi:uncharacterized membrane protein YgdD (TMEM256/DUF423 family)
MFEGSELLKSSDCKTRNSCTFWEMNWLRIAGALGFLGVALGAFGAHMLKHKLAPDLLAAWQTAVLYHLIHAAALLALALHGKASGADIRFGAAAFAIGVLVFSGSLYALALTGIKALGAITPLGGLAFLAGWAYILFRLARA